MKRNIYFNALRKVTALLIVCTFSFTQTTLTFASLPVDPNVVKGGATFNYSADGKTLTVDQKTNDVKIKWGSYNIGDGYNVIYNQPNSGSKAWNSDISGNMSRLLGALRANGFIALFNPAGILIGPNAMIKAAGFLASTLQMQDVMQDESLNKTIYSLMKDPSQKNGFIVNQGRIEVNDNGQVVLVSGSVVNEGVILAKLGKVTIASGEKMALELDDAGTMSVVIDSPVTETSGDNKAAISNTGEIIADGGIVSMTADTLKDVFKYAVNNEGLVQANTIEDVNGEVYITANDRVNIAGTILAKGGKVTVNSEGANYSGRIMASEANFNANDGDTFLSGVYIGDMSWTDNENIYIDGDLTVDGDIDIIADLDDNGSGDFGLYDNISVLNRNFTINAGHDIWFGMDSLVTAYGAINLTAGNDIIQYGGSFLSGRKVATTTPGTLTGSLSANQWYNHDDDGYSDSNLPTIDFTWDYELTGGSALSFTATAENGSYIMHNGASVNTNGGDIQINAPNGWLHIANGSYRGLLNAGNGYINLYLGKNLVVNNVPPAVFRAHDGSAGVFTYVDNNLSQNVTADAYTSGTEDPVYLAFNATFADGLVNGLVDPVAVLVDNGNTGTCGTTATATQEGDGWVFSVTDSNDITTTLGDYMFDWTAPTITPSRDIAPNSNGWNNTNVTVSYAVSDALSGIDDANPGTDYSNDILNLEGAGQSATGTVYDIAGNMASATESPINIDKTAPTITPVRDIAPNTNGWNNTDVTVSYNVSDALSGVDTSYASDSVFGYGDDVVSSEGYHQMTSGTVYDLAGNLASAIEYPINIDKTAPNVNAYRVTLANVNGWNNTDVDVTYDATDGLSGIDLAASDTKPVTLSAEGAGQSHTFTAYDLAGNSASDSVDNINIDKTAPDINAYRITLANGNGWNNTDVDVSYDATDGLSGIDVAASDTKPVTLSAEGAGQSHAFTAYDLAGNSASDSVDNINIDKTAPDIDAYRITLANGNGWNNTDVDVTYDATDGLSGIDLAASDTKPVTLSAEGAGQSHTFTAYDLAGNSASDSVGDINIDKTAPDIDAYRITLANGNGWNNTDVDVTYDATDALSGIDVAASDTKPITLSAEGAGQSHTFTAYDLAGNSASDSVDNINIDKTAPDINAYRITLANGNGWNNTDVDVSYDATDGLSGIDAAASDIKPYTLTSEGAGQSHTFTAYDLAGNSASDSVDNINIDKTAPDINAYRLTLANANGWNNTDVDVTYDATDGLSGIDVAASDTKPVTLSAEGAGQSHTFTAYDLAGNSASDSVDNINIDKTAPDINAYRLTLANANGWNNTDVDVTYDATDGLSGIDVAASDTKPVTLSAEGAGQSHTFTAYDLAGNSSSDSVDNINIDKTAPTITSDRDIDPNAYGWNNTDVTVSYVVGDALSGIDNANPGTDYNNDILSSEGAGQSATGAVFDLAGNSASATESPINIDKTAPDVSVGSETGNQNPNGTWSTDVQVSFDANDPLSGIVPNGQKTITGFDVQEVLGPTTGEILTSASICDLAGNCGFGQAGPYDIVFNTAPLTLFNDQLKFKIPPKDLLDDYQVSATQGPISFVQSQVYAYHPLTEVEMYNTPDLSVGAYEFIDGQISNSNYDYAPFIWNDEDKDNK